MQEFKTFIVPCFVLIVLFVSYILAESQRHFRVIKRVYCNCSQVETVDKRSHQSSLISELYIRGWRVTDSVLAVFAKCWPPMIALSTVNLWRVGLTDATLSSLASIILTCPSLKTLILDGNPVKGERWDLLIQVSSIEASIRYLHGYYRW